MGSLLDDIEADATPTVAHAEVCVDGRLLADYQAAQEQLATPSREGMLEDPERDALSRRFAELHEQLKAKTRRYTFRCLDRVSREKLKDKFPPTQKQAKKGHEFDPSRYEPALAAATLVEIDGEPVHDDDDRKLAHFQRLYRELPEGAFGWGTIVKALNQSNYDGTQVPKSVRDIGDRFVSALSSTTAASTESRSASSEGG